MRVGQLLDMHSVDKNELFFHEKDMHLLDPGAIVMILLMDSKGNPEWVPCTIQDVSKVPIPRGDLNNLNDSLDTRSVNLWNLGHFSKLKYTLTYIDSSFSGELKVYFVLKDVIRVPLGDPSPRMDTRGMTQKQIMEMLKPCSHEEELGFHISHKCCSGLAYDFSSKKMISWREPTPREALRAPDYIDQSITPINERRIISDEDTSDLLTTNDEPFRSKRRIIYEDDETPFIGPHKRRVVNDEKRVTFATGDSLNNIREIPGLDREFRDEYRTCYTCSKGFINFKGELINPDMPVEQLLSRCIACLNEIIFESDTNHIGKILGDRARTMTHKKCFMPMAGTIARHPDLKVLVTNYVKDTNPVSSHQLRDDFMALLVSAFKYHGKNVMREMPTNIPMDNQIHLVRLTPSKTPREGTHGIRVNQVGAPGYPLDYFPPL